MHWHSSRDPLRIFPQDFLHTGNSVRRPVIYREQLQNRLIAETRFELVVVGVNPLRKLGDFRVASNESPKIGQRRI